MDRLIATNSVPLVDADTPPLAGTPQGATDGDPANGVPPTRWPAYQYMAIQEELVAIIAAAGIALDRMNTAQVLAAIRILSQRMGGVIATNNGSAPDVYNYTLTPALAAYVEGMPIFFKIPAGMGNTVTNPTITFGPSVKTLGRPGANLQRVDLAGNVWYCGIYNAALNRIEVQGLNALAEFGYVRQAAAAIANDGSPHTIFGVGSVTNSGKGTFLVEISNGASSGWQGIVSAFQFATSITPGSIVQIGTPGSIVFSMSGTNLQLSITGGAGGMSVGVVQLHD